MKKAKKSELNDWGPAEYKRSDLGKPVRGKYATRIAESTNVVVLDPEIAEVFPNDEAVNQALRRLMTYEYENRAGRRQKNKTAEKKRAA